MAGSNQLIQSTGKLRVLGATGSGTAWCCGPNLMLTAAHCLNRGDGSTASDGIVIDLPSHRDVKAELHWVDKPLDAAVLKIPKDIGESLVPLRIGAPPSEKTIQHEREKPGWYTFGFPRAWTEGLYLTGVWTGQTTVDAAPCLQVDCDQGGQGLLEGASGSAVCYRGGVVGIVRSAVLNQQVIFVSPLDAIRRAAVTAVEWGATDEGVPYHPLHAVPPGPMPDFSRVSDRLIKKFAELNSTLSGSRLRLKQAVRIRRDADPDDPEVTVPLEIELPVERFEALDFWTNLFSECCKHGPRMLYALLEAQGRNMLDLGEAHDLLELIDYMKTLWKKYPWGTPTISS